MYYMCDLKKVFFKWHKRFLIHQLQEEYNIIKFLCCSIYLMYILYIGIGMHIHYMNLFYPFAFDVNFLYLKFYTFACFHIIIFMYSLDPVLKIIYKCMYYMCNLKEIYFKWHQIILIHQLQEEYSKRLGLGLMSLLYVLCFHLKYLGTHLILS